MPKTPVSIKRITAISGRRKRFVILRTVIVEFLKKGHPASAHKRFGIGSAVQVCLGNTHEIDRFRPYWGARSTFDCGTK
jgi:hypothetical protein